MVGPLLLSSFWNLLQQADEWLFTLVNTDLANPVFDVLMPFMRNAPNWAPLYIFVIAFAILNFGSRGALWVVFLLCTVALTDMTGTYLFKHTVQRIRPCNDPDFFTQVRLLVDHCSSGHSFVSNHAANHFGLGTFFFLTMRRIIPGWASIGLYWAGLIGIAQIYVGVHYPFDVLAGSLLGVIFGTFTAALFNKRYGLRIFDQLPTLSS